MTLLERVFKLRCLMTPGSVTRNKSAGCGASDTLMTLQLFAPDVLPQHAVTKRRHLSGCDRRNVYNVCGETGRGGKDNDTTGPEVSSLGTWSPGG